MKNKLLGSAAALVVLAGSSAFAADLPVYVEPVAPAPMTVAAPLWTGFYVGAQVGAAMFDHGDADCAYDDVDIDDIDDLFGGKGDIDGDWEEAAGDISCVDIFANGKGFDGADQDFDFGDDGGDDTNIFAGAHIGYDMQFGSFVIGAVLDANWLNSDDDGVTRFDGDIFRYEPGGDYPTALLDGNTVVLAEFPGQDPANPTYEWSEGGIDWYGTARLRAGWAVGRTLIYASGGLAFGGGSEGEYTEYYTPSEAGAFEGDFGPGYFDGCEEAELTDYPTGDDPIEGGYICSDDGDDDMRWGYALGGGVDFLVTDNVSVGAEALYVNLDGGDGFGGIFDEDDDDNSDLDFWTIGVKASYRFGG